MWTDNDKIMTLFDKANTGETKFPCECPVCQKQSAHIYIHRHNDRHCGVWTWCSECRASSHMSGNTPAWWENPDFVDSSKLCSEPTYLDKMADGIDEWVNQISPKDNAESIAPFVMEDRFNVRLKEDLQGIPAGETGVIVVKNDFKTLTVEFITNDGLTIAIHESSTRLTEIVEVVNRVEDKNQSTNV